MCEYASECGDGRTIEELSEYCWECGRFGTKRPPKSGKSCSPAGYMDKLRNVLTEDEVDWFAAYWCDEGDTRNENLGQFIQRVAQYAQGKITKHITS